MSNDTRWDASENLGFARDWELLRLGGITKTGKWRGAAVVDSDSLDIKFSHIDSKATDGSVGVSL